MPVSHRGAQRASRHVLRPLGLICLALSLAVGGLAAQPGAVRAAAPKVVLIVGPTGSRTASYIDAADRLASRAAKYGATVVKIYSPNATWGAVLKKAQGADLLIYLGHGNGWPSPYAPYQPYTKNGMGLNSTAGDGHYNHKYWGEYYIARDLELATNAVVILHRLCYASGNSEPGHATPTLSVAKERVDNFGAGFLQTGARAVFAEGISDAAPIIDQLFTTKRYMKDVFLMSSSAHPDDPNAWFKSVRTPGKRGVLDPDYDKAGRYYRSLVGDTLMRASEWRAGAG